MFMPWLIKFLGPTLWEKPTEDTRRSESLNVFKNRMRTTDLSELISDNCENCLFCVCVCVW